MMRSLHIPKICCTAQIEASPSAVKFEDVHLAIKAGCVCDSVCADMAELSAAASGSRRKCGVRFCYKRFVPQTHRPSRASPTARVHPPGRATTIVAVGSLPRRRTLRVSGPVNNWIAPSAVASNHTSRDCGESGLPATDRTRTGGPKNSRSSAINDLVSVLITAFPKSDG